MNNQELNQGQTNNDHTDCFYVSLYDTIVSSGLNEQLLIWMRYSAFLVFHGFILNVITRDQLQPGFTLCLSVLGMICSTMWYIMNFMGWLNQNFWFKRAQSLPFNKLTVRLPTEWWGEKEALKPTGRIYAIAQIIPVFFLFAYAAAVVLALNELRYGLKIGIFTASVSLVLAIAFGKFIENKEYTERLREENKRGVS